MSVDNSSQSKSQLKVGRTRTGYLVCVEGRGTMQESTALHEFAAGCLGSADCVLAIDLSQCEYLDSTFMGCLVDLYKECGRSDQMFQIVAGQQRAQYLLASTHLHTVLPITESPPELISECLTIRTGKIEPQQLGRHVMECHRRLAELGGPNQAVFRRIADQLAQELGEEGRR